MKLFDALSSTSPDRVRAIAAFYGIPLTRPDVSLERATTDLCRRIAAHLLVPANALVAMNGLNQEEMLALRLITIACGGQGVVVEQCHQKLNQLSRKWRRNGAKVIEALISRGLVFTRREGYRHIYYVATDLREVLAGFFLTELYKSATVDNTRFAPRRRSDVAMPLRHVCLFLSYLRKNEVRLTQSGSIFKKAQNDLQALIEEESAPLDETLFPVRYPPRLAFLLYFAKSKGLVEERSGSLCIGQKASSWVETPYESWRRDLFEYWRQTFVVQDTDLQTLLWVIMKSPEDSILSLEVLLSEMDTLSTNHSSHGLDLRVERSLVDFLEYLGGVEVASSINGLFLRPTPTGRALFGSSPYPEEPFEQYVYVQSNFEVFVPSTVGPRILWAVDAFAELHKQDQMMVFKLTRNSVYRALLLSHTPETIAKFLDEHSKSPVPQNVAYSIAHWGTSYGRIEFEEAILLKCDTAELADELMLSPRIRPHLKGKVGPCCLVVNRAAYDQLISALADEGYMPKISAGRRTGQEAAGESG
jgi:hypothetical protein